MSELKTAPMGYVKEEAKQLAKEGKIKIYTFVKDAMLDKYFSFSACKKLKMPVLEGETTDVYACSRMASPRGINAYVPVYKRDKVEIKEVVTDSYYNFKSTCFFVDGKEVRLR